MRLALGRYTAWRGAAAGVHAARGEIRGFVAENAAVRDREADMMNAGSHAPCPAARAGANPAAALRHAVYGSSARRAGRAACSPKLPALHREGTRLT